MSMLMSHFTSQSLMERQSMNRLMLPLMKSVTNLKQMMMPSSLRRVSTAQSRHGEWQGDGQDRRLRDSIENDGIMSALLVRPIEMTPYGADTDAEYAIIAGSRRYHAAAEAGKRELPCKVIRATDFEAAVKSLKENEERKDLTDEERARSMKMQYEMIKPTTVAQDAGPRCPDCGSGYDDPHRLDKHITDSDCCEKPEVIDSDTTAATKAQARRWLATEHYPELADQSTAHATKKVKRQIGMANLPDEVSILLKPADGRTDAEKQQLKNYGIKASRDLSSSVDGATMSTIAGQVVDLHEKINAADGVDATDAVLRAVGDLDFNQTNSALKDEIRSVKSEVSKKFKDAESPSERREAFRETLNEHQQQLRELEDTVGMDGLGKFQIQFKSQKYKRYHALAKQQQKAETNAEVIKSGYQTYLEQQAEEYGW
jgi:ParB/RepB/Spo0J family partition protein